MAGPLPRLQAVVSFTNLFDEKKPKEDTLQEVLRPYARGAVNARIAGIGGAAVTWTPPPSAFAATTKELFRLPGGQKPDPEKDKEKERLFEEIWRTTGIGPPGSRLRDSTDQHGRVVMTDNSVEIHLPIELPILGGDPNQFVAARGRLVMACTDPGVPDLLKKLRGEANPDQSTGQPPEGIRWTFPWRVDRIESDMVRIVLRPSSLPAPPPVPTPPKQ
jgi:hypothetical protein